MAERLPRALRLVRVRYYAVEAVAALMPRGIENLDLGSEQVAAASLPAVNGYFTARSLAKLYALIANFGELNGVELLGRETVETIRRPQNRGVGRVVPYSMRWRLGYHRVNTIRAPVRGGLGHSGFGGSGGFADPERNLAVAMVLNSGAGTPFGDLRIVRIGSAAVRCADRR